MTLEVIHHDKKPFNDLDGNLEFVPASKTERLILYLVGGAFVFLLWRIFV